MFETRRFREPRAGGGSLPPTPFPTPVRPARVFSVLLLAGLLLGSLAGCMTAPVGVAPAAFLTAHPNPSADGAYTVSWAPVTGASTYRLHENGALSYDGPDTAHAYADKAEGSYTYSLTYCLVAFGIEACNFKAAAADVTVTVTGT